MASRSNGVGGCGLPVVGCMSSPLDERKTVRTPSPLRPSPPQPFARTREKWLAIAIALILGGAIGNNLIDRVVYGHVVDFIQVFYKNSYFPSFNVADSAITVGTILLLVLTFFEKSDEENNHEDTKPS